MNSQKGFGIIAVLIAVVALSLTSAMGWYVLKINRSSNIKPVTETTQQSTTAQAPASSGSESAAQTATTKGKSGVKGRAIGGPVTDCYSPDPNSTCGNYRPYQNATIDLKTADRSRVVASAHTDANGNFTIDASPGTYVVSPQEYKDGHVNALEKTVTVTTGQYVDVTIVYDQ